MKRKGITLSINIIVVMIMGIVLIAVGLYLLRAIITPLDDIHREIGDKLKADLARLRFRDEQVVGLLNTHETIARGKDAWYLLGFVNEGEKRKFRVLVDYVEDSPVDDNFSATPYYSDPGPDKIIFHKFREDSSFTVELDRNQREFMWLLASVPKTVPKGDYMFDVYVCVETTAPDTNDPCSTQGAYETYSGTKQRLYLNAK